MNEIELVPAELTDKPVLRQLLELYQYDTSDFDGADVDAHGFYGYKYLDHYWTEAERHPFLIKRGGQLVGFALISDRSVLEREGARVIVELFVMRKYRRRGVGAAAAKSLFELFPGQWEIFQEDGNIAARAFWDKVIDRCAVGDVERTTFQSAAGKLWVQSFCA